MLQKQQHKCITIIIGVIKMKTMKYFSATWCGPCQTFKPVMNEIVSEGYSVQFIDIDQSPSIATHYNVMSVPTVIIEDSGIEVDRFVGSIPKQQVLERLI
jgi:thioredoxin 1